MASALHASAIVEEHSFASIVKTQSQEQASRRKISQQSPTPGDKEPKKPLVDQELELEGEAKSKIIEKYEKK